MTITPVVLPADLNSIVQRNPPALPLLVKALGDAWADGFDAAQEEEPSHADNPYRNPCQAPSCDDAAEFGRKVCNHHRRMFEVLLGPAES